jgi:hypothetical protein
MADQFANGQEAERLGFGLHVPFLQLSEDRLMSAVDALVGEKHFADNAAALGSALVDQVRFHGDRLWAEAFGGFSHFSGQQRRKGFLTTQKHFLVFNLKVQFM